MKIRHFFIIASFLAVLGLIYYPILNKDKVEEENKAEKTENYIPIFKAVNKERKQHIVSYGQVTPNNQIDVTMEVQGVIERENRSFKPGATFKKNEILIKIERTEALYNLLSRRSSFANLISALIPDIALDIPEEKEKWNHYLSEFNPVKELAPLPELTSRKEKLMINARNIPSEYFSIKALENQIEKYYYLAPFNGTVISNFVEPGSMITPGMRIATIAKTDDYEITAPINMSDIELFKGSEEVYFTNHQGDTVGKGSLTRVAKVINQQTQSIDAFFSIKPVKNAKIYQGMFLNLSLSTPLFEASVALPENAVLNNQVQLLKNNYIQRKKVAIVGSKPDSIFVTGLNDSVNVVLEPYSTPEDSTYFIGIYK